MEGSQGAWAAFNLGARVRITVSHNRSKEEVKQSVDRSFNDLFEGIVVPPLGFVEERKSWQGNTLTFSLSAKMGLVRTPIKGTVEVTDCDLTCSALMSLQRTISRWMKRAPRDAEPARRWLTFLRNHREAIAAMDFFTVPTITFSSLYAFSSSVTTVGVSCTSISQSILQAHGSSSSCEKHFHLDPPRGSSSLIVMPSMDWRSPQRFDP